MTDLTAALEALRPQLAEIYANQVRRLFGYIVEKHGVTLNGVYNSSEFARSYRNLVAPCVTRLGDRVNSECILDEGKLAARAADYAQAATLEWKAKIEAKLGDLENVQIRRFHGCNFLIGGLRAGRQVAIEQNIIVKSSTKGLLFNQFPARIYVDGKFTPEKKYHALFA
jgi:hypothetical protein